MRSNNYIITFVVIMTVVVASVLSGLSTALKPVHDKNEAIFNKKAVLAAIQSKIGDGVVADKLSDEKVLDIFENKITQHVVDIDGEPVSKEEIEARGYKGGKAENIDMAKEKKRPAENRFYPVYEYDAGDQNFYIVSVRGSGLWDEIWGNIALKDDLKTVVGASFDHAGETPGLGAEIKDNSAFKKQFQGKKIYDAEGNYTSIVVRKGGARNPRYEVDGISGATVTCDGVTDMLYKGIKHYQSYFDKLKKS